jgi:hypothetical protein
VTERLSAGTVLLPQHLPGPTWPQGDCAEQGGKMTDTSLMSVLHTAHAIIASVNISNCLTG